MDDFDDLQAAEEDPEAHLNRPLTRSSVKPRLLFQNDKTDEQIEEEEAVTDVEENEEPHFPETPSASKPERACTPEAPRFAPASPPSTRRVTRSTNKLPDEGTPIKPPGKRSPFDSWRRTKEGVVKSPSRKRSADSVDTRESKRTRI
jgi:hypothetical protein